MKLAKLVFLVLVFTIPLYTQNIIDPPKLPNNFNDSAIYDRNFDKNNFIYGWNWGSRGLELDEALMINYYHQPYDPQYDNSYPFTASNHYIANHRKVVQLYDATGGRPHNVIFNAQAFFFYPTITVDSTDNFVPRHYDSSGAVFGFSYKDKVNILDSNQHSNKDYHFVRVNKTDGIVPTEILSNIWPAYGLHYLNYDSTIVANDTINGKEIYLSINLKSFESIPDQYLDSTILSISMPYSLCHMDTSNIPYTYSYTNGTIKFSEISNPSLDSLADLTSDYGQYRGKTKKLSSVNNPTSFIITGRMLKYNLSNQADSSLTLTAKLICDKDPDHNPLLTPDWYNHPDILDFISSYDIKCVYNGKIDLGIRYIRLATKRAMDIFEGMYDQEIAIKVDTLENYFQTRNTNGIRIHRFYGDDEMISSQWAANRYFNMLVDTMASLETFVNKNNPKHYLYATGFKEYWNGDVMRFDTEVFNPFIKKGKESGPANMFSYKGGYGGNDEVTFTNTKDSPYETFLMGYSTSLPITDTLMFEHNNIWPHDNYNYNRGLQFNVENLLYDNFYKNSSLIFNNKPWWANLWVQSESWYDHHTPRYDTIWFKPWIIQRIDTIDQYSFTLNGARPRTGEEIRLMINTSLNLGAKGLVYWFKTTQSDFWNGTAFVGLQPNSFNTTLTGDEFLYSDEIGGDYINVNDDPNNFDAHYKVNYNGEFYDFSTMGIDSNHIFIGLKSARTEMKKIHTWILNNETTIMNLKLQAWYGKGFLQLYRQDPSITDTTIIRNYVNIDNIKTRPPGRIENDQPLYEQHSTIDSGFYDITLFKDNRYSIQNSCIITVQNRRTDPLIEITSNDSVSHQLSNRKVGWNFIPSAEFDQLCDGADSTFWRSKWWQRLGAREIRLPFNYQNTSAPSQRYILKIQELIDSSAYNNNWSYWRKEKWNRKVDTLIMDDDYLALNFLPGEGRMLKVQIIPKLDFTGELDYSAQNKMVVYPTHQTSQKDFSYKDSSVYYHLVYHKFDSTAGNYNVYYRRSVPTFPSSKATNIEWEATEYKISRVQRIKPALEPGDLTQDEFQNSIDGCNCKYPTITVRFDSVSNEVMAYILYNCKRIWNTDSLKNYVVETVFPANYIGSPTIPDTSNVIEFAYIGDLNNPQGKWGVPTINASYSGNYYAWADSLRGIMVGWKSPNDRDVITTKASIISGGATTKHLNPNFNTYSRMLVEENSCSLVWEGDSVSGNAIFYTRISRSTRGNITPAIYMVRLDTTQDEFDRSVRTSTYARFINWDTQYPTFPSVHKPVSYKLRSGYETADSIHFAKNGWDRVVFMDKYDDPTHKDIYIKAIDYSDSLQAENHLPTTRIASLENRLLYPFITQGNISRTDSTFHQMVGRDSSLILTFTEQTPITNNVYQYNLDFWSPFLDPMTWDWSPRALFLTNTNDINPNYLHNIGVGILAHPSNSPITNRKEDFWLTRTVFQHNGIIKGPSPKLMYKGGSQKKVATRFIGFNSNESPKSSSITPILFDDGNYLPVNYGEILANKRLILYDTMRTDWFKINEIKKFGFTYFSLDSNSFKMYIQKQSDRNVFEISPQFAKKKAKINRITCINGRNENYRLIFVKNDASFMTNENIVLGYEDEFINRLNFLEEEPLFKQAESNSQVINLNPEDIIHDSKLGLSVYPNPANDELYVVCYLPRTELFQNKELKTNLQLKLYNNLGKEVYSKEIRAGQITRIPTDNFQSGNYFVKVFQQDQTTIPAEVRNVIIEK